MKKTSIYIILLLSVVVYSCENAVNVSSRLFPNPPDTSNFVKFAGKLSVNEKAWLIADTTYSREGKIRKRGIQEVPQDGDDFRGFGFDGGILNNITVRDADFRGDYFRSANAIHSNFSYSDFRWVNMESARFFASKLISCNFTQASMFFFYADSAILDSSLLLSANLFGIHADDASLRYCNFSNALMRDADFINSDFTGSIAIMANMEHSVFIQSKMDSMDLSFVSTSGTTFKGASFVNSRLWYADLSETNLDGVDFSGADLKGCNFNGANFKNTIFKGAFNIPAKLKSKISNDKYSGTL